MHFHSSKESYQIKKWKQGWELQAQTDSSGKLKEQVFLEAISSHMKYIEVFGTSRHGVMKKSCLNDLIA